MSVGHAGESLETIQNTKQWLLDTEPEEFDCTIITTYPGSPYFDDAVREGMYMFIRIKEMETNYTSLLLIITHSWTIIRETLTMDTCHMFGQTT